MEESSSDTQRRRESGGGDDDDDDMAVRRDVAAVLAMAQSIVRFLPASQDVVVSFVLPETAGRPRREAMDTWIGWLVSGDNFQMASGNAGRAGKGKHETDDGSGIPEVITAPLSSPPG